MIIQSRENVPNQTDETYFSNASKTHQSNILFVFKIEDNLDLK